jgi:heat shock protein HtpX
MFFGYLEYVIHLIATAMPLLVASLPGTLVLARYREYAADRGAVSRRSGSSRAGRVFAAFHGPLPRSTIGFDASGN